MKIESRAVLLGFLAMIVIFGDKTTAAKQIVTELAQGQSGKIYYKVPEGLDITDIISGKFDDRKTKVVYGKLRLPSKGKAKKPAVVIMHGSGGVSQWRELKLAKKLKKIGIATFIPYSLAARGVHDAKKTKGTGISFGMRMVDAYTALNLLSTHPQIDAKKIGIIGYSSGGNVSLLSSDEKIRKVLAKGDLKFATHVNVYPATLLIYKDPTPTNAPVLFLIAEKDDWCFKDQILRYAERMKRSGADVQTIVYPGAYHLFDSPRPVTTLNMDNDGRCQFEIQDDGDCMDPASGETFSEREWASHTEPCTSKRGVVTLGRNKSAAKKSVKDIIDFFSNNLQP
jgi:dienelactone hydrolase